MNKEERDRKVKDFTDLEGMKDEIGKKLDELDNELDIIKLQKLVARIRRFFLRVWRWVIGGEF